MPYLSIIIPVYNAEKYLRECLFSVYNQAYTDFECIIIDDGSTDQSWIICQEFEKLDKRFSAFHISNHGVSNARNLGISKSKGDYITFIDADDYVDVQTFKLITSQIAKRKLDVCCYGMKQDNGNNKIEKIAFRNKNLVADFIKYPVYMHSVCNKVFNRSLLQNYNIFFDNDLSVCEDMLFCFKSLTSASKIGYVEDALYSYRENGDSVCHSSLSPRKLNDYRLSNERLSEYIRLRNFEEQYKYYIRYREMFYAIIYLVSNEYFNPDKYRKNRSAFNYWFYSFRPDLFVITFCSALHVDFPAKLYNLIKTKRK